MVERPEGLGVRCWRGERSAGRGAGMVARGEQEVWKQIRRAVGAAVRRSLVSAVRGAGGRVLVRVLGSRQFVVLRGREL